MELKNARVALSLPVRSINRIASISALIWFVMVVTVCVPTCVHGDDRHSILRFDPIDGDLYEVPRADVKEGYIYSHFDERLNRRIWSFALRNGDFWRAMGEGTTQEMWRFDLPGTRKELEERAERDNRTLLDSLRKSRKPAAFRFRLNSSGQWKMQDARSVVSVYNAETGQRWEKHSDHYIPVISTCGNRWTIRGGAVLSG